MLVEAAELGAEYVDLEWDAASRAAQAAVRTAGARVIVSRHDFVGMPNLADEWWPELAELGPDVVKVVGTAADVRDCLQVAAALTRTMMASLRIAKASALPRRDPLSGTATASCKQSPT